MTPSGNAIVSSALRTQIMSVRSQSNNGLLACGSADWAQRCEGMCTVHVQSVDAVIVDPVPAAGNAKLVLDVNWRSGQAEGQMLADATAGTMFTIGAVDVVSIAGFFEPTIAGAPLIIAASQRVDVSAHWSTSKGGVPAMYTPPGVVNGVFLPIPRQARSMTVLAPTAAGIPTTADFATAPNAGSIVYQAAPATFLSQDIPVQLGARFVRFGGAATVTFPVFQLWT